MDSHVLRRIGLELACWLIGARIETVYRPHAFVYTFKISTPASRPYLIFQYGREDSCLLAALKKPDNPHSPGAPAMRLRKYLNGRKICGVWLDWEHNSLYLGLAPRNCSERVLPRRPEEEAPPGEDLLLLCLNMRLGPHLHGELPKNAEDLSRAPAPPVWDIESAISSLSWQKGDLDKPWQKFPQLTPLLRKTLSCHTDAADGLALLADLENGSGDIFVYSQPGSNTMLPQISAWPLPKELHPENGLEHVYASVLDALEDAFILPLFSAVQQAKTKDLAQELKRNKKRLLRALAKLDQEEERLHTLAALKKSALLIQSNLYRLNKQDKPSGITLADNSGLEHAVGLDAAKTIAENMEQMFAKAAKAQRGMPRLALRRAELKKQLRALELENPELRFVAPAAPLPAKEVARSGLENSEKNTRIARLESPTGLTLLRGKNAEGNREVLKKAAPYDIWLHAEGGPGAHLIIKLPHAAYAVPEVDMEFAARLAAEKSWQRNERRASVICALAKNVRPIKGAVPGAVQVDKILRTLSINL